MLKLTVGALISLMPLQSMAADILIENANMFDGTGSDTIKGVSLVIDDGIIKKIQIGKITEDADLVIDASGKTIMSGIINGHFHLFWDFYSQPPLNPGGSDERARHYMDQILPQRLKAQLEMGITSTFSPIDYTPYIFEVKKRVETGEIIGPRIFASGSILMKSGNHYACGGSDAAEIAWCNDHVYLPTDTPEKAAASVRELHTKGADVIVLDLMTNQSTLDAASFDAVISEAKKLGLKVVSHNTNARDVPYILANGLDGFVHPPSVIEDIDGTLLTGENIKKTFVPATLGFYQRYISEGLANADDISTYELQRSNILKMYKNGAKPLFASDMPGLPAEDIIPTVVGVMRGLGIDNKDILISATSTAAMELLGRDDIGTIETGKIADIIILDADPTLDISALKHVFTVIQGGNIAFAK